MEFDLSSPRDLGIALVNLLQPKSTEKIYDGAFGSLGFLLEAKSYIDRHENNKLIASNFYGREINNELFDLALEKAEKNGLSDGHFFNENTLKIELEDGGRFDIAISCPPFGLKADITNIGKLGIKTRNGTNKFIQHYISSLKEGGRAAVVVTNSFLFSTRNDSIELRKYLIGNCNLHSILELPSGTFSYTNISTSVIFFTKEGKTTEIKYYSKAIPSPKS